MLEKGTDTSLTNDKGFTTLLRAAKYGHIKALKQLLEKGANIKDLDKDGKNALMVAISGSKPENSWGEPKDKYTQIVKWLLPKLAIDAKSKTGKTALIYAIEAKNEKIVKLLFAKGANPNIKVDGKTAVDFVETSSMAKVFQQYGVEISCHSPWDSVIKHSKKSSSETLKNFVEFAKLVSSINKTEIEAEVDLKRGRYKRNYEARIPADSTQALCDTFRRESLFAFNHLSRDTDDLVKAALKKYKHVKLEYEFKYAGAKSSSLKMKINKGFPWKVSYRRGRSGRKVKLSIPNAEFMKIPNWVSPWQTILLFLEAIESKDKTKLAKIADSKINANTKVDVLKLFATLEKQKAHFDKIDMALKAKLPQEYKKKLSLNLRRTKDQDAYKHLHGFAIKSLKELFQQNDKWLMDYVKTGLSLEYKFFYIVDNKKMMVNLVLTWTGTHWIVANCQQKYWR